MSRTRFRRLGFQTMKSRAAFLSHSSLDAEMVLALCSSLEARGIECWMAPRDLQEGQSWALGCLQGVAESQSFVLLGTENALASYEVLTEVAQAHKRAKPIYTILIPPAKVRGEMDFYLARLHWLEGAGRTPEDIAAKLSNVIGKDSDWKEVAGPPGLQRTMRYRPMAFLRLAGAFGVMLAFVLGGVLFAVNRLLNLDFRRLGYIDLAAEETENTHSPQGHAQVWLMASGVRFGDVRLRLTTETAGGKLSEHEVSTWPIPEQVSSMEAVEFPLAADARRVTTCLIMPNGAAGSLYRVTQEFVLTSAGGPLRVAEVAEKRVSREDRTPCAPKR